MAGFLIIAGLTGSLLAWNDELEVLASPQLMRAAPPTPDAQALDPVLLRELMLARHPGTQINRLYLHYELGRALMLPLEAAGAPAVDDQVFANPYTGDMLGSRKWGDLTQGMKNLMPFIYRLHYSLALETVGQYFMGIVALAWTLDCFVGVYLTFPASARSKKSKPWLGRWWSAWKVRRRDGTYKLNFDLHRAGGLWPWAMLLVLAWSSVAFNLPQVYDPMMRAAFAHQLDEEALPRLATPQATPGIGWFEARDLARRLMAEQAGVKGFTIHRETLLAYDPGRALFRYVVLSSRDIRHRRGSTQLVFDANTGEFRGLWLPTAAASGDTIRTWLTSLHMAAVGGVVADLPMKLFICAMGLAVAMLSVTGVVIWARKRRARTTASAKRMGTGATLASRPKVVETS